MRNNSKLQKGSKLFFLYKKREGRGGGGQERLGKESCQESSIIDSRLPIARRLVSKHPTQKAHIFAFVGHHSFRPPPVLKTYRIVIKMHSPRCRYFPHCSVYLQRMEYRCPQLIYKMLLAGCF